jgi:hypothetical protein
MGQTQISSYTTSEIRYIGGVSIPCRPVTHRIVRNGRLASWAIIYELVCRWRHINQLIWKCERWYTLLLPLTGVCLHHTDSWIASLQSIDWTQHSLTFILLSALSAYNIEQTCFMTTKFMLPFSLFLNMFEIYQKVKVGVNFPALNLACFELLTLSIVYL